MDRDLFVLCIIYSVCWDKDFFYYPDFDQDREEIMTFQDRWKIMHRKYRHIKPEKLNEIKEFRDFVTEIENYQPKNKKLFKE
jgi:hypothetical protein